MPILLKKSRIAIKKGLRWVGAGLVCLLYGLANDIVYLFMHVELQVIMATGIFAA